MLVLVMFSILMLMRLLLYVDDDAAAFYYRSRFSQLFDGGDDNSGHGSMHGKPMATAWQHHGNRMAMQALRCSPQRHGDTMARAC